MPKSKGGFYAVYAEAFRTLDQEEAAVRESAGDYSTRPAAPGFGEALTLTLTLTVTVTLALALALTPTLTRREHLALLLRAPDLAALVVVQLVVLAAHVRKHVAHAAATPIAHEPSGLVNAHVAQRRRPAPSLPDGWTRRSLLWASSCGHRGGGRRWGDEHWT